jgi:hypothetical protein
VKIEDGLIVIKPSLIGFKWTTQPLKICGFFGGDI